MVCTSRYSQSTPNVLSSVIWLSWSSFFLVVSLTVIFPAFLHDVWSFCFKVVLEFTKPAGQTSALWCSSRIGDIPWWWEPCVFHTDNWWVLVGLYRGVPCPMVTLMCPRGSQRLLGSELGVSAPCAPVLENPGTDHLIGLCFAVTALALCRMWCTYLSMSRVLPL